MSKKDMFDLLNSLDEEMDILLAVIKGAQYEIHDSPNLNEKEQIEIALSAQYWRVKGIIKRLT